MLLCLCPPLSITVVSNTCPHANRVFLQQMSWRTRHFVPHQRRHRHQAGTAHQLATRVMLHIGMLSSPVPLVVIVFTSSIKLPFAPPCVL